MSMKTPSLKTRATVPSSLSNREHEALDNLLSRLRQEYPKVIEQVILFGSRARGEASPESDFDLLIVTKDGRPELADKLTHLADSIGYEYNLVFSSHLIGKDELMRKGKLEPFYRSILSEGIDVYGNRPRRISRGKPLVHRPPTRGFKMDENARSQIARRLERAYQNLDEARTLLEAGKFPGAVSRAYYAVFNLTTAVLLTLDLVRTKHSGVESAFSEYFIRPKRLEEEYKDIFIRARKERELADYELKEYTEDQARHIIADCERFIARMERYLREAGAIK